MTQLSPNIEAGESGHVEWPSDDFRRIPYQVYTDPDVLAREDERLFRGPHWSYLGLEVELKNRGDYLTGYVGLTPYVLVRDRNGALNAMVNRCAHRGAEVVRKPRGNARSFLCIYHNWNYDLCGDLAGVALERGRGGMGGYDDRFDKTQHGLRRLRVDSVAGVVFGTFSDEAPALRDYLGPQLTTRLERLFERPIMVTGYQRHTVRANWKLLVENSRDLYHAPQLHPFFGKFGVIQAHQRASVDLCHEGTHSIITIYEDKSLRPPKVNLEEPRVTAMRSALPDGMAMNFIGIFPNCVFSLAGSALSIRQLRPKTPGLFEAYYTYYTYADDPQCLHDHLLQNNMFGPAGYVAMEDAEVLEKLQSRLIAGGGYSLVQMDGYDSTPDHIDHLISEANLRSYWKGYCKFMGFDNNSSHGNGNGRPS